MGGSNSIPPNLVPPTYVREQLGDRPGRVLNHGFGADTIGPDWWAEALANARLCQRVRLFPHGDLELLTRGDIFELARPLSGADATDNDYLSVLWHVLAWGTGKSQRGNLTRIRAFVPPSNRDRNVALLRTAAGHARCGEVDAAYRTLVRSGGGKISGLGPAFFTKYLYFVSEGCTGTRCLILDARVAKNLATTADWKSLPHRGDSYSCNWYTATYVAYCELLERWAQEETSASGVEIRPDEFERALFGGG